MVISFIGGLGMGQTQKYEVTDDMNKRKIKLN
jgi:hypothetical protein